MYKADQMWVAIDCLVFGYDVQEEKLKVLLFKRKVDPFSGQWSLIGGLVNYNEDIYASAERVLKEFTGLEGVFLEQLHTYGKADRDPGGRVISILFWSLIKLDQLFKDTANAHGAKWFDIDELPQMVLDHCQMIENGKEKLRFQAKNAPLGFELLPENFTMPQLLRLYQAIYDQQLDDRNFRKKILSTKLLVKQDFKDKSSSKKGAYFYQFDKEKYQELKKKGYHIEFVLK
ncbi:NUDIX hydrolase [Fulvivirga sediminis]|uniref:NUDIX hydrolase n=1 Tax=Fulvivirga sediminis TaxID=2803949 RepID=A0A937K2E2_9BACT|nr:NUDIX domain-containing protein [Fulvivirga sediminis]MBL3658496.1 NUDIX hydrolase [Fulvivirga sediminis]